MGGESTVNSEALHVTESDAMPDLKMHISFHLFLL